MQVYLSVIYPSIKLSGPKNVFCHHNDAITELLHCVVITKKTTKHVMNALFQMKCELD